MKKELKEECSMCEDKAVVECSECNDKFCNQCKYHDCFFGKEYSLEKLQRYNTMAKIKINL